MPLTSLVVVLFAHFVTAQDRWSVADAQTTRLSPAAFSQLPKAIRQNLQARGCTIPQSYWTPAPHNVIKGEFAKKGQTDWAVLCSKRKVSSILVFWGGSRHTVSEVARKEDQIFLQEINEAGSIRYSRMIDVVGRKFIISHYEGYAGPKSPPINHQGIDDGYLEKASTVHYFHRGRWLKLQGAD